MSAVKIREYTKSDLDDLLHNDEFWSQPRLPITKHRVHSQLANPRCSNDDVVLLTASNAGSLVAYLGIIPDMLRNNGSPPERFGWLSTWWADEARGGAAAAMLFFDAIRKWNNRIAISYFSPDAKRVYDAFRRFDEFANFELSYFILASPPEWPIASPVSRWTAGIKNRMIFSRTLDKYGLALHAMDSVDETTKSFVHRWTSSEPLARDGSDWGWILQFPWVSAASEDNATQKQYEFSVFARDFRQLPILVSRDGVIIGFLFLTLRDGRLWLKYAYYEPTHTEYIAAALKALIAQINPWTFVSADEHLNLALRRGLRFYIAVHHKHAAGYGHKALHVPLYAYQFGIGDNVFT